MNAGFFELTIILAGAAVLSIIAKMLKQPTILAYLAVGALINYLGVFDLTRFEIFDLFSDIGIMLLLFLVGLEINYVSLRLVGKVSLILGVGQILFTTLGGFIMSQMFGFDLLTSAYIGVALSFSSTIIIIKLLSDKKDLNSLYGKISIGFLLVQDLVAVLMLVMLSSMETSGGIDALNLIWAVLKAAVLFAGMLWLGRKIMPLLFDRVAHSPEILFITSLAWVFALAVLVHQINFSIEIAGFLAGIALANSSEHFQIAHRIRPLRDFFIMLFFVGLGASFTFSSIAGMETEILTFSLYILIGNPLIVMVLMGVLGYRKRTGFLTGLTVAQISEFSLILMALGLKLGHVTGEAAAIVTLVGIITIAVSTNLITYGNNVYRHISTALKIFEKRKVTETQINSEGARKPIILVGYHRIGRGLAQGLKKDDVMVVDFDPSNITHLENSGLASIFGDITDEEVFDAANCVKAKLVISTSPDYEDNLLLISRLKKIRRRPKTVLRAENEEQARDMYEAGADYVLLPHLASGHALGQALSRGDSASILKKMRDKDLAALFSAA
jgi:Kef-type K+ transport system membrane component KefB